MTEHVSKTYSMLRNSDAFPHAMSRSSQSAACSTNLKPMEQIYRMYLAENRCHTDGFRGWLNEQELLVMPAAQPNSSVQKRSQRVMEYLKGRRCLHWHPSCGIRNKVRLRACPDSTLLANTCLTCTTSPFPSDAQFWLRNGCLHMREQCAAVLHNDMSQPDQAVFLLCQRCCQLESRDSRGSA